MKKISIRIMSLLLLVAVVSASCDKDNTGGEVGRLGSLEMKINDNPWKATMSYVVTAASDEEDGEAVYLVAISGFKIDDTNTSNPEDEEGESLILWFALPEAKFNNPKGTYDAMVLDEYSERDVMLSVQFHRNLGFANQRVYTVTNDLTSFGKVTITDFDIGQQSFLGQAIGGKAYTRLKGTFQMSLQEVKINDAGAEERLLITDGKFDVRNQLDF